MPLTARLRDTARQLWILYIALTALQALLLMGFGWFGIDDRMHPFMRADGPCTLISARSADSI